MMSYYMNYWHPDQPMCSSMSPTVPKSGSCCGTASMGMAPYAKQQWAMPQSFSQPMVAQYAATMQQPMPGQQPASVQQPPMVSSGSMMTPSGTVLPLPSEQSYIENILRMNLGKVGTFYMTYENNSQWNAKIFRGKIEGAGRDHIILSDPKTNQRIILLMVNFDYATFDEPLNYQYPFNQTPRS